MNIISRMTVQHLKQNKKRTIVTILGIMLSVALIMAISAFAESFLDLMRQQYFGSRFWKEGCPRRRGRLYFRSTWKLTAVLIGKWETPLL